MTAMMWAVSVLLGVAVATAEGGASGTTLETGDAALDAWIAGQAEIVTWSADVVQTRRPESLVRPSESEGQGQVWFRQSGHFRWQLGDPPTTVAVRGGEELVALYPELEQFERYSFGEEVGESWRQVLALLEVGFPSDAEAFHRRYELISAERADDRWQFQVRPRSEAARQLLHEVRLEVSAVDQTLLATELAFPDGSTMRNDFTNHRLNPELDPSLFAVEIDEDEWEVFDPLQQR